MITKRKIEEKKQISQLLKEVEKISKLDKCMLCHKKVSSFCNSHVVPQFILKEISNNGKVSYGQSLINETNKNTIFNTTTGINNAFTFKLICNNCDQKNFSKYENPNSILNYDKFDYKKQNQILTEMSIKTHLEHISRKLKILNLKIIANPEIKNILETTSIRLPEQLDIREHLDYINQLNKFHKSTNFPYLILYDKLLDYNTNLATQTLISYIYDINGKLRYDPKDLKTSIITRYFYLIILPCEGKTRILFYIEKKSISLEKDIIEQFKSLSDDEKLHFLFISLIIFEESFYMNPLLKEKLLKDKKLIKLYKKTDNLFSYKECKKIKNFRKYNNYLIIK